MSNISENSNSSTKKNTQIDIFQGLSHDELMNLQDKNKALVAFDPQCIRQKSNWSKASKVFQLDSGIFKAERLSAVIPDYSPKLNTLLKKIENLDRKDQSEFGHTFKHFIFSDLKSGVSAQK